MDLTIAPKVVFEKYPRVDHSGHIDPTDQGSIDSMFWEPIALPMVIPAGRRILASTVETVEVPRGAVGLICLRSTWARLGLIAPPTVADPGFHGTLTMEVFNGSRFDIKIEQGMKVWSISYLTLAVDEPLYQGRYQGQTGLQLPKALKRESAA
ncbi:MAG: dCTP deaminase [Chloroflexota bacterium]|nr:dCTP deaminase [Chloroflexota bacterium]